MSLICPRCGTELPGDHGQEAAETAAERDRRFPFWRVLPWTLLAALALLFLPFLRHGNSAEKPASASPNPAAAQSAAPPFPAALPAAAPQPSADGSFPLTVTLYSAAAGRHIQAGAPVTISAYAALPAHQSATLAVALSRDRGPKSLLALAQGTLSTSTWVPQAPGHYRFTATALDSRKNGASSRPLSIWVDAPAAAAPEQTASDQAPAAGEHAPHHSPRRTPRAAPPPYRVAAATFPIRGLAETLAGALRRRGFHAFVRANTARHHKTTYAVETGNYPRSADAEKQVQVLKRDGYPSYVYQAR